MSKHASPTAQLLRNSRLFSLPQALPRPIAEQYIRNGYFLSSDSATTPYPLRQAIVAPSSSASRGDWGLKRPLPKRAATRSSQPVHSVVANDTYESVTDYHSASPHVKTLRRFQELSVGMSRQDRKMGIRDSNISALEPAYDNTDRETGHDTRWKYVNGHVRTMTPGEFDAFLQKNVANKKEEFITLLRARFHRQQLSDQYEREKVAVESGETFAEDDSGPFDIDAYTASKAYTKWVQEMTDAELSRYLELAQKAVTPRGREPEDQEGPISPEIADQAMTLAFDGTTRSSKPELQDLAAFTYARALQSTLRDKWWNKQLELDSSHEGELLRQKLSSTQVSKSAAAAVGRPAIGNASAAKWLKFLHLIEKLEKQFLRAWATNEWDIDGTLFSRALQTLRKDITLESPLNKMIREFLDMPPTRTMLARNAGSGLSPRASEKAFNLNTHPTAGLSYLRTNSIMHNHPILGPQKDNPPVKSRFLANIDGGRIALGVAGFVTAEQGRSALDITAPGGVKVERHIQGAHVDGDGRINVELRNNRDNEALAIRDGSLERSTLGWETESGRKGTADLDQGSRRLRRMAPRAKPIEPLTVDHLRNLAAVLEKGRGAGASS